MKNACVILAATLLAGSAYGQGTVMFGNKVTGFVDARVIYSRYGGAVGGGNTPETQFVAQLYASVPGGTLAPVGDPIPFRSTPAAGTGYWPSAARTIPGVSVGGTAQAKVVAWSTALGSTYEQAKSSRFLAWGESAVIQVVTGSPAQPAPLIGLQGFTVVSAVDWPEPSAAALGLLGAGLLLIQRKRH